MVSPHRIRYNNIFSNELNIPDLVMCVAMDSDNGETPSFLNREAVSSESHDGRYKRIHRFKYTENFAPKFSFFKKDLSNFEIDEVRSTLKWLTSKDTTALLEAYYDDSNVVSWASIGGFVDLQTYKIANNRTIAITATWDSISPFAMSDLYTITKVITSPTDNIITINIDTDDNQPVYPRVTIKHNGTVVRVPDGTVYTAISDMVPNTVYYNGATYYWKTASKTSGKINPYPDWELVVMDKDYSVSDIIEVNTVYYYTKSGMYYWIDPYYFHKQDGGNAPSLATTSVKLTNTHTDFFNQKNQLPPVVVKNNNSSETVVLDGANKIISSNSVRRVFGDDFENWRWLELRDGKNEIAVEGNCTVTIEWREVRKIGEW